jgi:hypothetical protein
MDEDRSQELAEELAEEVRESENAAQPDEIPEEMKSDARPWGPADYDEHGGAGLDPTAAARPADDCASSSPHQSPAHTDE